LEGVVRDIGRGSFLGRSGLRVATALAVMLATCAIGSPAGAAAPGAQRWVSRYDGVLKASQDQASAIAASPDGSLVFVTGETQGSGSGNYDYLTIAYDAATGSVVWSQRYDGPIGDYDHPMTIAVNPDGSAVYVTGTSVDAASGGPLHTDYATIAYGATTGSRLWLRRTVRTPGGPASLGVSPDGSIVFLAGETSRSGGGSRYTTVALDTSSGARVWVERYAASGHGSNIPSGIAVSPSGSTVFVTGQSESSTGFDYATVAYAVSTGTELWVRRHDGSAGGPDAATSLAIDPAGSTVFVSGGSTSRRTGWDMVTLAYRAADGSRIWAGRYDGPTGSATDFDIARAIGVSPDGSMLFVTGDSTGRMTSTDFTTIAYAAVDGARVWTARYDGPSSRLDWVSALGVSPDGSTVFITGTSDDRVETSSHADYATVAYEASSGVTSWVSRYDGPAGDWESAQDLVVSPDGTMIFVTGSSERTTTGFNPDYVTVAYGT
jgi:DNA-binding beta-propeller fold protein YncE